MADFGGSADLIAAAQVRKSAPLKGFSAVCTMDRVMELVSPVALPSTYPCTDHNRLVNSPRA
jgi:hypothetical protein